MSRDGFRVADHDPRFLHDVKVRRLRREAGDDGEGAIRTLLYLALRDTSWSDGERLAIEDADSPYEATPERVAALQAVGLVDADGRIPEAAWDGWFTPAWDRREKMRTAGRETNRKRWGGDRGPVSPSDSRGDSRGDSPSVSPSVPSVTSVPSVPIPSAPSDVNAREIEKKNGTNDGTCPGCGDLVRLDEPNVSRDRRGVLWHTACPDSPSLRVLGTST